jgi:hypothetical protein
MWLSQRIEEDDGGGCQFPSPGALSINSASACGQVIPVRVVGTRPRLDAYWLRIDAARERLMTKATLCAIGGEGPQIVPMDNSEPPISTG